MSPGLCPYPVGQMFYLMVHGQGHLGVFMYLYSFEGNHIPKILFYFPSSSSGNALLQQGEGQGFESQAHIMITCILLMCCKSFRANTCKYNQMQSHSWNSSMNLWINLFVKSSQFSYWFLSKLQVKLIQVNGCIWQFTQWFYFVFLIKISFVNFIFMKHKSVFIQNVKKNYAELKQCVSPQNLRSGSQNWCTVWRYYQHVWLWQEEILTKFKKYGVFFMVLFWNSK